MPPYSFWGRKSTMLQIEESTYNAVTEELNRLRIENENLKRAVNGRLIDELSTQLAYTQRKLNESLDTIRLMEYEDKKTQEKLKVALSTQSALAEHVFEMSKLLDKVGMKLSYENNKPTLTPSDFGLDVRG